MPQARTKHFATVHYDETAVLTFPAGLPAFEEQKRFVLLERPVTAPVVFLQSLDDTALCLPAVPIGAIDPEYDLSVTSEDLEIIKVDSIERLLAEGGLACLAVISVPEGGPVTANLLAPVVVNRGRQLAVQAVRPDARYSYQHPIVPAAAAGESTCSS